MKYFTITLLCGFFCLGNFQMESDINDYKLHDTLHDWHPNEEHIGFLKPIQNYPGLFLQKRRNVEPCVRIQSETLQQEQPINNKILNQIIRDSANRRFLTELSYKPLTTTENAILQPQVLQEDNQLKKVEPTIFQQKNLWHRNLNHYDDHDLIDTNGPLERVDSIEDFDDDNVFIMPPVEQKRVTDKILNLKQNTKQLMNSIPNPEPKVVPSNVQCTDKTVNSINDPSRRFMASDDNVPNSERENNFEHKIDMSNDSLNTNTSLNILLPRLSPIASNKSNLHKSNENRNINILDFEKLLEPLESEPLSMRRDDNLNDPTQGKSISNIRNTKLMLMNYDKVCYACSSANNPTCLSPDRRTTVKYCRKGVNACVTKTYKTGDTLTLIRDCGKTCDDFAVRDLGLKYRSCSICHSDLCNSAYSNNIHNLIFTISSIVLVVLVKILL